MRRVVTVIKNYFKNTETYSIPRIIGEFVILDVVATVLIQFSAFLFLTFFVILPITLINPQVEVDKLLGFLSFNQDIITEATSQTPTAIYVIIFAVIIAPFLETVIFKMIPVWALSFFTNRRKFLVLIPATIFALAHIYPLLVLYIFPGAVILTWTYVMLKKRLGVVKALLTTTTIHALFNLVNITAAMLWGY